MKKKFTHPRRSMYDGRLELWRIFNKGTKGFTNASPVEDFGRQLAQIRLLEGATIEGWFQYDNEITALYVKGSTYIILDRFESIDNSGQFPLTETRTVLCVGGASWDEVCEVVVALQFNATTVTAEDFYGA